MSGPFMKKVKGNGVEINLAVWEGAGKPVICVHGITANCRSFDVMAKALSPVNRVIAMDLRGRGRSDKPQTGYSLEHHLRDIICVMDSLGLEKAVLMGHSLGAFISLAFGVRYPDRTDRIILVDGGGKLSKEQLDDVFAAIKPSLDRLGKVFPSAGAYIETMKSAPYIHPWSDAIERYYRYEIEEVEGGVRCNIDPKHIQEEAKNIREVKFDAFYARVYCKVLILKATEGLFSLKDLLLPEPVVSQMIEEIPQARRFDVEGANHYGIAFQPNQDRDRAVLNFLNEPK
ncbi:MAG: alpha/beta fold hydrolase [Desulfobacterales bacterium]